MRRISTSIVARQIGSSSALLRSAVVGQGRILGATYATSKKRTPESELHAYFEEEVKLLAEDAESEQVAGMNKPLEDWAKRFHFHVNMGQEEVVATKKDAALGVDVTIKIDPSIEETDNPEDEDQQDEQQEEEEEEQDGVLGNVHFSVEVKKDTDTMILYGMVSEAVISVSDVVIQDAEGEDKSTYDVQRLDDDGQEKFRLYLNALGVNDAFVPAAYAAAQVHDEQAYHKWVHDVLSFTKQ